MTTELWFIALIVQGLTCLCWGRWEGKRTAYARVKKLINAQVLEVTRIDPHTPEGLAQWGKQEPRAVGMLMILEGIEQLGGKP
jgi:hypothetical protein